MKELRFASYAAEVSLPGSMLRELLASHEAQAAELAKLKRPLSGRPEASDAPPPPMSEEEIRACAARTLRACGSQREAERRSGVSRAVLLALASGARVKPATLALFRERFREPKEPTT